jgi:hydroxymethylbilane synthase
MRLAARKSDLARLQAFSVARALKKIEPTLDIDFQFRSSLGDLNQTDPLWKMPERGVFTEDFLTDLVAGRCDMVVHSWKDLPTETRIETTIAATLPRADHRDVFLLRKDRLARLQNTQGLGGESLKVFTSSPRRAYNLEPFFKTYLPWPIREVQFLNVRGNIQTRVTKLLESTEADGLVLAKAALDRLLEAQEPEFEATQKILRQALKQCQFMVLPLSLNPAAAAQGALAIEVRRSRHDLLSLLKKINCKATYQDVQRERQILASYGGGCHQKIGVSCLSRPYGEITFLRGSTDAGEILNSTSLRNPRPGFAKSAVSPDEIWPLNPAQVGFFKRETCLVDLSLVQKAQALWVARENSWPVAYRPLDSQVVWSAGLKTWQKLAQKGIWVHGCSEGLGEHETPRLEAICSGLEWLKLTHSDALSFHEPSFNSLAVYKLIPLAKEEWSSETAEFKKKKFFFWMSASSFARAVELEPQILRASHACGPGTTADYLHKVLSPLGRDVEIYLSYEDWKKDLLGDFSAC